MTFCNHGFVCSQYSVRGSHDGDFMGIPASNETVEIVGTVITRIEDDRIPKRWVTADILGLLQQIGSVPVIDEIAEMSA